MPKLLDYCLQRNIRTVIGIVGSMVNENAYYKSYIMRAYTEGHIIAHHGYNNTDFRQLTADQILLNLKKSDEILSNMLGVMPRYILAPFGRLDRRVIAVLRYSGYTPLTAAIDSFDAAIFSNASIANSTRAVLDRLDQLLVNAFDQPKTSSFLLTQQMIYFNPQLQDAIIQKITSSGYSASLARECLASNQEPYKVVMGSDCGDRVCFYALENCESCPQDCGVCTDEYYKKNSIDDGPLAFIGLVDSFLDRLWILTFVAVSAAILLIVCTYRFYLWRVRSRMRIDMKRKLDTQIQTYNDPARAQGGDRRRLSELMDDEFGVRRRKI